MGYRMTARFDKMHRGDVIIKTVFCSKAERRNIPGTLSGKPAPFIEDKTDTGTL